MEKFLPGGKVIEERQYSPSLVPYPVSSIRGAEKNDNKGHLRVAPGTDLWIQGPIRPYLFPPKLDVGCPNVCDVK